MTTYKSPLGPPLKPASPSPETLSLESFSMPSGMSISIFLVLFSVPVPWHCLQGFFITFPVAPHVSQGLVVWNMPKTVLLASIL